ncbi:MAG: group II intron reverse transcriptase domain-containing protein [Ruminococcus sp.]|nr:group II intron reverse transcriptase domain-containing protein [Ruminococcus sp.]
MSLLDMLSDAECWESFYCYKTTLISSKSFERHLRAFIDEKRYLPVCQRIEKGEPLPLPRRAVISKLSSGKKRVVYTYPEPENTVLKLLTHLLLREYDHIFSPGLFSFRHHRTAKDAVRRLISRRGINRQWSYKADISNYFNSIPIERFLPILRETLSGDAPLREFLTALLTEPSVLSDGEVITEGKGIMAGTPLSAFYADLYLADVDAAFAERGVTYARYSDDIIIFASSEQEAKEHADFLRRSLTEKGLTLNPDKECFSSPEEGWSFLGFVCKGGRIDIAPATLLKLKHKMRRKARALRRWADRTETEGSKAAKAFIRIFNRKLLECSEDNELCWSKWFFPLINTDASLKEIDAYAQECIRFIVSGTRTKARYNVRYEDMKALGYRSLVNEYYSFTSEENG